MKSPKPAQNGSKSATSRRRFLSAIGKPFKSALNAARVEASPKLSPSYFSKMTKREAIVRFALGTAAIAITPTIGRRLSRFLLRPKKYTIHFDFGEHGHAYGAENIVRAIENAKKDGNPFTVFLRESPHYSEAEFERTVKQFLSDAVELRKAAQELKSRGFSDEQAKNALERFYTERTGMQPFNARVKVCLALNNIALIPIETYSGRVLDSFNAFEEKAKKRDEEENKLEESGATLAQRQKFEMENQAFVDENIKMRDTHIKNTIPQTLERTARLFPDLHISKESNILAHMGGMHRPSYYLWSGKKVEVMELPHAQTYTLRDYYSRNVADVKEPMSQRKAMLETLSPYVDQNLRRIAFGDPVTGYPARPEIAQKAFSKAIHLTQQEFEKLSRETERLNRQQRMMHIIKFLTDGQVR